MRVLDFDSLEIADRISALRKRARDSGINIVLRTDFANVYDEINATEGPETSPAYHPKSIDLTEEIGFFLMGYKDHGKLVHTQAMRLDHLGKTTLAEHWKQQIKRLWTDHHPGTGFGEPCAPSAEVICGRVVYHGDMWLHKDFRSTGLAPPLVRLGLCVGLQQLRPDFVYGFIEPALQAKGFGTRNGYPHQEPNALNWWKAPPGIDELEWMVWASKNDILNLVRTPDEAYG